MTKLPAIQIDPHFPARLQKSLAEYNSKVQAVDEAEAAMPGKRAALIQRITAGEISGAAAVAERRALADEAQTFEIDRMRLYHARQAYEAPLADAHTREADRLAVEAKKRAQELIDRIGDALPRAAVDEAIRRDGAWRGFDEACRDLRSKAKRGVMQGDTATWRTEAEIRLASFLR